MGVRIGAPSFLIKRRRPSLVSSYSRYGLQYERLQVIRKIPARDQALGLNGSPALRHSEAVSFQIATDNQAETDRGFRTQSVSDGFSALHDVLAEGCDDCHQLLM